GSKNHPAIYRHLCAGHLSLRPPQLASVVRRNDNRSDRRRKNSEKIVDLSRRQADQDVPSTIRAEPGWLKARGGRHENAGRYLQDRWPECAKQLSSCAAHFLSVGQ